LQIAATNRRIKTSPFFYQITLVPVTALTLSARLRVGARKAAGEFCSEALSLRSLILVNVGLSCFLPRRDYTLQHVCHPVHLDLSVTSSIIIVVIATAADDDDDDQTIVQSIRVALLAEQLQR